MHVISCLHYAADQAVSNIMLSPVADLGSGAQRCATLYLDGMHFMWCLFIYQQGVNTGEATSSQRDTSRYGPGMSAGE